MQDLIDDFIVLITTKILRFCYRMATVFAYIQFFILFFLFLALIAGFIYGLVKFVLPNF